MADTLADVLPLFTRVNTALVKRLEKVESTLYTVKKAQAAKKDEVVEESEPVEIESFGTKALAELNKVFKVNAAQPKETKDTKAAGGGLDWLRYFGKDFWQNALLTALKGAGLFVLAKNFFEDLQKKNENAIKGITESTTKTFSSATESLEKSFENLKSSSNALKDSADALAKSSKTTEQTVLQLAAQSAKGQVKAERGIFESLTQGISRAFTKGGVPPLVGASATQAAAKAASRAEAKAAAEAATKNLAASLGGVPQITTAAKSLEKTAGNFAGGTSMLGNLFVPAWNRTKQYGQLAKNLIPDKGPWKAFLREEDKVTIDEALSLIFKGGGGAAKKILSKNGVMDAAFAGWDVNGLVKRYREGDITREEFNREMAISGGRAIGSTTANAYYRKVLVEALAAAVVGGEIGTEGKASSLIPRFIKLLPYLAKSTLTTYAGDKIGGLLAQYALSPQTQETMSNTMLSAYVSATKFGVKNPSEYVAELYSEAQENYNKKHPKISEVTKTQDAIITSNGRVIQPHMNDTLYAMKDGGPMGNFFNKNLESNEEGNKILKFHSDKSLNIMSNQVKLMQTTNNLLQEVLQKINTPTNIINSPKITTSGHGSLGSLRALQGVAY
jgi:hypothetical protein